MLTVNPVPGVVYPACDEADQFQSELPLPLAAA